MKLSVVVGVSVPYKVGPSGWYVEGIFGNGAHLTFNGNSFSGERSKLSLAAISHLLRSARKRGVQVTSLVVTMYQEDIAEAFVDLENYVISSGNNHGRAFNKLVNHIPVVWDLRPDFKSFVECDEESCA